VCGGGGRRFDCTVPPTQRERNFFVSPSSKNKKVPRTPLHPTTTTINKPTIIPTNAAKMGKRSHSKDGPSKPTSLDLTGPASSKGANNRVLIQEGDAEEGFLENLSFGVTEGFEVGLNELDGGYSDNRNGGGGGGIGLSEVEMKMREKAYKHFKMMRYSLWMRACLVPM